MVSFIFSWFKSLSNEKKILIIVISVSIMILSIQTGKLARSEYLRLKSIEKALEEANTTIKESENKELSIVDKSKEVTKVIRTKNNDINNKLKQDEETNNNDSINDADIINFISKHKGNE